MVVGFQNCDSVYFAEWRDSRHGRSSRGGQIWMLCTPAIYDYPHTLLEKQNVMANARTESYVTADERNKVHIKLLRFLGFKFLEISYGPNNLSFIEFCRVQSSSNRTSESAVGSAASASQANKAARRNYEHQLKVRERKWMQTRATYGTKRAHQNKKLI